MITKKNILIIGGGISGISAAVEVAEVGHNVILVEKLPYLGGRVIRMNQYFPKLCPPYCGLEINFRRIRQNPGIKVFTSTTVEKIEGSAGNFSVHLKSEPAYVNENCTACGECEKVCPVDIPDQFNYKLSKTKAIHLPHELAFPFRYFIDENYCLKEECNRCRQVCIYDAISFSETIKSFTVKADSIIYATGWEPYEASGIEHLNYSKFPDVITNVEMERLAALNVPGKGRIKRPSDNSTPENIVFVQCAGSRDEKHLPYCSAVCCSVSLKQALNLREKLPDAKIKIYYIDLRVSGRNEDLLTKVKNDQNIKLVKGKVSGINEDVTTKKLMIEVEDILSGRKLKEAADLIVLATGMKPSTTDLEQLKSNEFGFLSELEQENGIYIAACAKKPMDVSSSIKDACGMALKAIQTTTADNCKQLTNTNKYQSE